MIQLDDLICNHTLYPFQSTLTNLQNQVSQLLCWYSRLGCELIKFLSPAQIAPPTPDTIIQLPNQLLYLVVSDVLNRILPTESILSVYPCSYSSLPQYIKTPSCQLLRSPNLRVILDSSLFLYLKFSNKFYSSTSKIHPEDPPLAPGSSHHLTRLLLICSCPCLQSRDSQ